MKGLTWIMKLMVSAVVTSVCCVALTFMAANTYVDMLLDQYHIQRPAGQKLDWSSFASRFTASLGLGAETGTSTGASSAPKDLAVSAPVGASTSSGTAESGGGQGSTANPSAPAGSGGRNPAADPYRRPDDAVAVWGQQSASELFGRDSGSGSEGVSGIAAEDAAADRQLVASSEELTKKKEQLSDNDKAKIFSLLVSRVPQEEMQKISLLMESGITAAELKELEQLLQTHLKPEEYKQLVGLITKETP